MSRESVPRVARVEMPEGEDYVAAYAVGVLESVLNNLYGQLEQEVERRGRCAAFARRLLENQQELGNYIPPDERQGDADR